MSSSQIAPLRLQEYYTGSAWTTWRCAWWRRGWHASGELHTPLLFHKYPAQAARRRAEQRIVDHAPGARRQMDQHPVQPAAADQ